MSVFVERASGARRLHIFWAKLGADFEYVRRMLVIDAEGYNIATCKGQY